MKDEKQKGVPKFECIEYSGKTRDYVVLIPIINEGDRIIKELNRDATTWEGIGLYQNDKTYVCYVVLSRYELLLLERNIKEIDEEAFLIKNESVKVDGYFEKKLITK